MCGLVRNLWSFLMSLCPKVVISQYSSTKPVTSLLPSLPQRALLRLISQHLKRAWLSKWPAAVSEETQALKARDTGPSSSSHATFDCKGKTICSQYHRQIWFQAPEACCENETSAWTCSLLRKYQVLLGSYYLISTIPFPFLLTSPVASPILTSSS